MELVWTSRAQQAQIAAIDYVAQEAPVAALNMLDEIERQTDALLQHPEMGRPGRVTGTRELVVNRTPYIIIYRIRSRLKRIELIRFLHGAQQWP
ncbi:type II toxin-antitoxin system mRNA interferase toxin, RelE/StbE family [Serratia sp. S1B]|nr:type II toxin-antitoxin system mRNA interferase toxin, RelE/StbE family [Serratia sp. S1B]